jgi:DNA repair protein RadC
MYDIPIFRLQLIKEKGPDDMCAILGPDDAGNILIKHIGQEDREHFVIIMLDTRNKLIGLHTVSIGTLNTSLIHPREVFKAPIISNAATIILGHNHPSGDLEPSKEDHDVTDRLKEAGELLGIRILDHIIVSDRSYRSILNP